MKCGRRACRPHRTGNQILPAASPDAQNGRAWALAAAFMNTQRTAALPNSRQLELDPTYLNAKRYLEATKAKVRQTLGP